VKLTDRGDVYEIEDYSPILEYHPDGQLKYVIYCPYIPKKLFTTSESYEN